MNDATNPQVLQAPAAAPAPAFLRIKCADLAQVLRFRGQNDVRYYLNGFYAEPLESGGCILVSTDGHRLGVISSAQSHVLEPVVVRTTPQLDNLVMGLNSFDELVLDDPKALLRLERSRTPIYIQPGAARLDANYPNWRKIFALADKLVDGLPGHVNVSYLQSAIDALAASSPFPTYVSFQHVPTNDDFHSGAIVIRSANSDLVVAVMPAKAARAPLPAWLRQISEQASAAVASAAN